MTVILFWFYMLFCVPAIAIPIAMLCDTALIITAMLTGYHICPTH